MGVLFEPRANAVSVEVMLARKEEHFLALAVQRDADGAHVVLLLFVHSFGVQLLNKTLLHAMLCSQFILEILVVNSLESFVVHSGDW